MGKKLVIVESPAKAKTIGRYLGPGYHITASVGHIRDLPSSSLGVDVNNNFKPLYINMRGKEKIIKELKALATESDQIFLATDPDREGEAIAWHIANVLKMDLNKEARITFNEITAPTVRAAVLNPRTIDMDLVNAQQARRVLDRLVGYELSPLLWKKVRPGLSAGRVQSVATRMLVEREEEIRAFIPEEYWNISAEISTDNDEHFRAMYQGHVKNGDKLEKVKLTNKAEADAVLAAIHGQPWKVLHVKKGNKKRQPYAPFTTSTLQQEAARRLGYSSKKTMAMAQQLYEGVDIPGVGPTALVTYIRTDSVRVSKEAQDAAHEFIQKVYGADYLPPSPRFYKNKSAAQDAHEAIRPAHFEHKPESLRDALSNDQYRLYKLIWERFIASQMAAANINTVVVDSVSNGELFRTSGETIMFPGFLIAYADVTLDHQEKESKPDGEESIKQIIPPLKEGQVVKLIKIESIQKFTLPPPRYTEASLIKAMEEQGIGRPSTYAPTISTILSREYAVKEKRQLVPTNLGFVVTEILRNNFSDIINVKFTANMEAKLDTIENGQASWGEILQQFYPQFHKLIVEAQERIEKIKMPVELTGEKCPECHEGDLVIKEGRFGKFIACSNFPNCKYTKNIVERPGAYCPLCGAPILMKKSRKGGVFYVCSKEGEDKNCPFISWDMPINGKKCETCGAYMVSKKFHGRTFAKCSNPNCPTNVRKSGKNSKTKQKDEKNMAMDGSKMGEKSQTDNPPSDTSANMGNANASNTKKIRKNKANKNDNELKS